MVSDNLFDIFLIFFINIKYQRDFIMGKSSVEVSIFRDIVTADGEAVHTGTVIIIVLYSNHTGKSPPPYRNTQLSEARRKRESKNKKQGTKGFSTFAVYRLCHSETKKQQHCLIRESCFSGTYAKQPVNNLYQVTWLSIWLPK